MGAGGFGTGSLGVCEFICSSDHCAIEIIISSLVLIIVTMIPFAFAILLWKKRDVLRDKACKTSIGNLYKGHYLGRPNCKIPELRRQLVWLKPLAFMLRRAGFALATVFLTHEPLLQMMLH